MDVVLRGRVRSPVLDMGCGTGENILQLASLGYEAWAIDRSALAIERAKAKGEARRLDVHWMVGDALMPRGLGRRFNTIIDSGFFHSLDDAQRRVYAQRVARLLRPGGLLVILCFSDQDPFEVGPRRVSVRELAQTFHGSFEPGNVRAAYFQVLPHGGVSRHRAWQATFRRRRIRPGSHSTGKP